jgi:hypothetical protein
MNLNKNNLSTMREPWIESEFDISILNKKKISTKMPKLFL